eukprot:GHVR01127020.1.p1 GENE.GHVR01127020.1~~GHVR01127020.1.p1  ORF type:complete len:112 (+),score=13.46 GHVR01127020.1:45-380(+)
MKQEERLAYELELKEKEEIRFGFRLLDEDGSGSVSADELQRHLNDQGFNEQQSKAAITRIMEYCDKDGSGTIEEGEFVSLMTEKLVGNSILVLSIGKICFRSPKKIQCLIL